MFCLCIFFAAVVVVAAVFLVAAVAAAVVAAVAAVYQKGACGSCNKKYLVASWGRVKRVMSGSLLACSS